MRRATRLLSQAALTATLLTGGAVGLAGPAAAAEPAPATSTAGFEVDFMSDTVMHHNLAISMAQLCLEKATGDDQLKDLCSSVIASQTQQREQLQTWLQQWYGVTPPSDTELPPNGEQMLAQLQRSQGERFDSAVAEMFVRHHYSFLPDADKCRDAAYHAALADLCSSMYSEQQAQIPQFRGVVAESSGKANYGPKGTPGGASQRGAQH